jgi:hypothetical protein
MMLNSIQPEVLLSKVKNKEGISDLPSFSSIYNIKCDHFQSHATPITTQLPSSY